MGGVPGPPGMLGHFGSTGLRGSAGSEGDAGQTAKWGKPEYDCPESATDTMRLQDCSPRGCRLEVRFEDVWGTVCSAGWANSNGAVLCRALGFSGGGERTRARGGAGQVWLQDVVCKGGEGDVGDCQHSGWGKTDCGHADDVGLCCWPSRTDAQRRERVGPSYFPRCPEYHGDQMRLVDCNRHVCRLEVMHLHEWGTVCDNGFTDKNAEFVCKMMGFSRGLFKQMCATNGDFASCAANTGGEGRIWLDDVYCYGFERKIDGCRHKPWAQNRCRHKQDVGVCCSGGEAEKERQSIEDAGSNIAKFSELQQLIQRVSGSVGADEAFQSAIASLGGLSAGKRFADDAIMPLRHAVIDMSQLSSFKSASFLDAVAALPLPAAGAAGDAVLAPGSFSKLGKILVAAGGDPKGAGAKAIVQASSRMIQQALIQAYESRAGPDAFKQFQNALAKVCIAASAAKKIQQALLRGNIHGISEAMASTGSPASEATLKTFNQAIVNAGGTKAVAAALNVSLAVAAKKTEESALNGPPGSCPKGELSYDLRRGAAGLKSSTGGDPLGIIFGGHFAGANGFRFKAGQSGLGIDPSGCIPPEEFTIYMRVKLEQTFGARTLLHSPGWGTTSIAVDGNLMVTPGDFDLKCEETILPNTWYQIVVTRSKGAQITLYIHGGMCFQTVSESGLDWLELNPHSVQFFMHGTDNADGYSSSIRLFNTSLSEGKVAEICSCTLPSEGMQCKHTLIMNTNKAGTTYSSIAENPVSNGRLGSRTGWIPESNDKGQWMQFDTGFVQSIIGVVTQGRQDSQSWVTSFKVAVSSDGHTWTWVGCGRVFDANLDRDTRVQNLFFKPVMARYVRIFPLTWENSIGLRAGAIVCELPCWMSSLGHELDYRFQLSFLSSTMGPDLRPNWGEGEFMPLETSSNTYFYKFNRGQGLSLNQQRCINQTAWTIMINFALDKTSGGFKRVLSSSGWGDYGLYVNKYLMLVPKGSRMRCLERIRPAQFYLIYFTRTDAGKLALYINGAECASGSPPYKRHFQLNPADITFFKDDSGEDAGGSLRHITIWDRALNATEIELHSGCKRPEPGHRCQYKVVFNSPVSGTKYSSIRSPGSPGKGLGRGRLNSKQAWCSGANSKGQYMEIDMGFLQNITGFVTQGRNDADEWVTSYIAKASKDGTTWADVGCGTVFEGNTDRKTRRKNLLHRPIVARYLRIFPESWSGGMCMRFGMILCEKPCKKGTMDYKFDGSMMSITGGPSLDPAWGDGYFDENGYHFEKGLGMEVETQRCLMNNSMTTAYTVFMDLKLEDWNRPQILMSSDGWDQGGLVVNGWLGLAPSGTNMVCEEQHLKRGRSYKFTMTRSVSGTIVLYLNGAECQTGSPPFFRHFRLAKERVFFFHDDHEKNMDPNGVVRRIVMIKKALSREEVAKLNGCALPDDGATCEQNLVLNAVYKSHTYSSCGGGASIGKGQCSGRLNSRIGWTPASNTAGKEWLQIDTGEVQSVIGIVTQGRRDVSVWVTEYTVKSSIDGITWSDVQCGRLFKGNLNHQAKVKRFFRNPIHARYIRIYPEAWVGSIGMRAGVLVCERPCVGGELDYHLNHGSLMSTTNGPSLDARWGDGEWDNDGWHFKNGQGLRVDQDQEGCMNNHVVKPTILNAAYSIQITMKLYSVRGWQRIVGSRGWGDTGLYVKKQLQIYPTAAMMKCAEILIPNKWYMIFLTRSSQGLLKLYINGALCARGRPNYNDAYALHQHRIDFFHDDGSEHASGVVKEIHIWNRALTDGEVLNVAKCMEPRPGKACTRTIVFSPPSADFLYSSSWGNDKPGTGHARARLNSPQAWSAQPPYHEQYLQIDTGEVQSISGVVLQGRRDAAQWVTAFFVDVSSDGKLWFPVGCGTRFDGNRDQNTKKRILFYSPVLARYVRVKVAAWFGHPSMRAGILLCERPCLQGQLDYRFGSGLLSDTQGPPLEAIGGEGVFEQGLGYRFRSNQGLILDQRYCITQPEEWSIFIDVTLDSTSGWKPLMSSKGWGDYGLYVNSQLQMYPPAAGLKCAGKIHRNRYYKFIISRDKDGHVRLYVNGYMCADAWPAFLQGFKPSADQLNFFTNPEGRFTSSGIVKRIRLFDHVLSESEAAEMSECQLPQPAEKCGRSIIMNANNLRYKYSSTWENRSPGQKYAAGRLDSRWSWSARQSKVDAEWMQIDTGKVQKIEGLVSQGRQDFAQWVTSYKVMVSNDGKAWKDVQCGFVFTANRNQYSKVKALFDKDVKARFVRIFPQTWNGWMSMRAGVIVCERKCQGGQLDFQMKHDLESATMGPSLTAPWGIGHWSAANGFRFHRGQGFALDADTCMNAGVYTIYMHLRFDNTDRHNRLVASQGWSDYGYYVWNRRFLLFPKSSMMICDEKLFSNQWYQYIMTRNHDGTVAMYLNGYKCAEGEPPFADSFSLNPEKMQFLKDYGNNQGSGYVKRIRTWRRALSSADIADLAGCVLNKPAAGSSCNDQLVDSVSYSRLKYSTTWNNERKGVHHHGMGRLDSHSAWSSRYNDKNQWFQMDAGSVTTIAGVLTQGRNDYWQWVSSFRIDISTNGEKWEQVECGRVFDGNHNRGSKVKTLFTQPLETRFVRIKPITWHGHISMRAGLLLCQKACRENELDYNFKDTFMSSKLGPALVPQWGSGGFSGLKGYVFSAGQGLKLDEHKCIAKEKGWTIFIRAEIGSTHGWRRILNSGGWGDFGFYVYNGVFTVYPLVSNMACPWKILSNEEVTYVVERTKTGKVTMYQNGLKCAAGKPPVASRFTLDPRDVSFFRDDGNENTKGSVRSIKMWSRVLGAAEVAAQSNCKPLPAGGKCDRSEVVSPDNQFYSGTRCWANDKIGYRYCRPQLDSPDSWVPDLPYGRWRFGQQEDESAWLQIDAGSVRTIVGVVTQGRRAGNQHVTTFAVKVSNDKKKWANVDCGNLFEGRNHKTKFTNKFSVPIKGRYIRIYPKSWYGWPSLRAGLLLCAARCKKEALDYELLDSLKSSTSGPPLVPLWGDGYFTRINNVFEKGKSLDNIPVYRYHVHQGFHIDPSYCLKTSHEFSVLIQVRLDDANRFNRLLASDTWRRYGLFVKKNRLSLFPEDLDIACSAHLFKNQMYQLAITRGKGGEVKLYVDGYHCASGSVEQAPSSGLSLDLESVQFLHDPNGNDGSGYVRRIRLWGRELTPGDILDASGCELPQEESECSGHIVMNVAYSAMKFDSVLANNKVGTGWARGRLDSRACWIASNSNQGHWMQMDAGSILTVSGVATQGRYGAGWWTTSFTVRVSENGQDWKWVECGRRFRGNVNGNDRLDSLFERPVRARYVRIYPVSFVGMPSLRAAILVCETKCKNKYLDYRLQGQLTSSSGGPSLVAHWGFGRYTTGTWNHWLSSGDGYRFHKKQGLMLDESKCITDPKSYSVLIEVKLDSVAGDNAIMTSEEWFDDGLYVADEVFQMRPSPELRCAAEPIRAGYTYKFAVTRNKKTGQVSLYMNGYKCASGIPRSDSGFALEPNNMIFFRAPNGHSSSGWVKKIEIWDKTLGDSDILDKAECTLPRQESETCDDTVAFVPEVSMYTASSIYQNYKMGWAHYGQPRIGDRYCWSPDTTQCYGWWNGAGCNKGSRETFLQVDAGGVKPIAGVVTQGRGNYGRWVKTFRVKVSQDGVEFKFIECGRIFDGNHNSNSKIKNHFRLPVKARYVRFYPDTCYYNCDMRVGLLLCEVDCESGHLDYKLTAGVLSSLTGGPQLHAPWGQGTFDTKTGYTFRAGQGLVVDESRCIESTKTYSILIRAKLNQVDKNRGILTNEEWAENSLVVQNGEYTLKPTKLTCPEMIRPGYFYDFGITRSTNGVVSLYLNGYKCATGSPVSMEGYPLEENNIQFLRGVSTGQSSSGQVKRIQIWNKALSPSKMETESNCELPEQTKRCISTVEYNPASEKYAASSIYGNYKMGWDHYGQPRVGARYCWRPATNGAGKEWLQIDAGKVRSIAGLVTQGRGNYARWVKTLKVQVSLKGKTWLWVECGRIFNANKDSNTKAQVLFDYPVKARFVRIFQESCYYNCDLRAGLLLCESGCEDKKLDYRLTSSLASVSEGPSLTAPWGQGKIDSKSGYRFHKGKGLEVEESRCITNSKAWSVLIDAKFDDVSKTRGIMMGPDWGTAGVYIKDGMLELTPTSIVCSREPVRSGYYYRFGVTRSSKGFLTLYLNGYPCASGSPVSASGFPLDPTKLIFMRGRNGGSGAGYVKDITIWQKKLDKSEMQEASGCELPQMSTKCKGIIQFVPSYAKYTASSIYRRYQMGWAHYGQPRIGDPYCWKASTNTAGKEWLQIDLGKPQKVAGVVTQGRGNYNRFVKTFRVMVSESGKNWKYVECGHIFDGNTDQNTIVKNEFEYPVKARFVRIYPESSYHGFDLRAGVLLCETKCSTGHLEYDFVKGMSLTSVTGGPALDAPWGLGRMIANSGYRFHKKQGLELDEGNCIKKHSYWSVLMVVRLDKVDGYRSLLTSHAWKGNGPSVLDGVFMLKPSKLQCQEKIRAGFYYKFGITRTKDGKVTLYLNGYPCMTNEPTSSNGFELEGNNMIFFRGAFGESSAGYVKKIDVWEKTLTADEMRKECDCELPQEAKASCAAYIYSSPSYEKYTASSIYGNYKMGWNHYGHPRLGDSYCWKAASNAPGKEWLQIDTGKVQTIPGVVVQGRQNYQRYVKSFKVKVSQQGKNWKWVECGRIFEGNEDYTSKKEVIFSQPLKARYIRIYPETSYHGFDMRAGVLLCESNCSDNRLEYDLTKSLNSESGGPALRVLGGDGRFDSKLGYRFNQGQGLEVDESACIKSPKSYTIYLDVRLDRVDKTRALLRAEDWDSGGIYIKDGQFGILPTKVFCKEPIRENYFYRLGMSRSKKDGIVTLYINGYPCASSKPTSASGFVLDPDNIKFLGGGSAQSSAGYVKKIDIWGKALPAKSIKAHSGCSLPSKGRACTGYIQSVPSNKKWTASSIHGNYKMGWAHYGRPRLDDSYAWLPAKMSRQHTDGRSSQKGKEWLQVDLGEVRGVAGLITQGRSNAWQFTKTYKVMVSQSGKSWKAVECGRIFDGNTNYYSKKKNVFNEVVKARYVRIYPETCTGFCALRVGLLLCEMDCKSGELDYNLASGDFKSATFGPMISAPWGSGRVVPSRGYRFHEGKGFRVDESKCITDPAVYSVLIEASLDKTDADRSLFQSQSWGPNGLFVGNGMLRWKPSSVICKAEPIRQNQMYKFGVTVDGKGKVKLFLNGAQCAAGTPGSGPGTKLDATNIIFFHGEERKGKPPLSSAGYVKRIQVWSKTLDSKAMAKAAGCRFPPLGKACSTGDIVHVPPHAKFDMSSCWHWWSKMGKDVHALPKINSASAWCARKNDQNQWLQIDLEKKQDVVGVVTQGRFNVHQWVRTYRVSVSEDGKEFMEIECGRIFDGNTNSNTKVRNYFASAVKARYIRIHPTAWVNHISMRMGVLTCETGCKHDRLDYEMQGSLSSTGGPVLRYPWGSGIFIAKKEIMGAHYHHYDLAYLAVDRDECMKKCKERRDCVGIAVRNGQNAKQCWLKSAMEHMRDSNNMDGIFRTDTLYYKLKAKYGYVVQQNKGIQVEPGNCVKTQKEYTLLIEMALDRVAGRPIRLVSSADWGQKGAFVYQGMYAIYPWMTGLKCQEDIKAGVFYKFGLIRTKERRVTLYLNGWECASTYPPYANAFALDQEHFAILHDSNAKYNSGGYVRRIQLWQDAMSSTEMLEANDCRMTIMKDSFPDTWSFCSNQNQPCSCKGSIRYGDPQSNRWTSAQGVFGNPHKYENMQVRGMWKGQFYSWPTSLDRIPSVAGDVFLNTRVQGGSWKGEFFAWDTELDKIPSVAGKRPTKVQEIREIDYWDAQFAALGFTDRFVAKWTGKIRIQSPGTYTFRACSDDGSNVFVGKTKVVDNDGLHGRQCKEGSIKLNAREYDIAVNFFENGGGANCQIQWKGPDVEIEPTKVVDTVEINYWDAEFATLGFSDRFVAKWTGKLDIQEGGTYTFQTCSDDGSNVFIGGTKVVDNDGLHGRRCKEGSINLEDGKTYDITVNFFENGGGANCQVLWKGPDVGLYGDRMCNDNEFGDPAPGVTKQCQCNPNISPLRVKDASVTRSSIRDRNEGEWGGGNGIHSQRCWAPRMADYDEWLQMDLGRNETVGTVSTQGDPKRGWQVTQFIVKASYDGQDWRDVQCGRIWNIPWNGNTNQIYTIQFEKPVLARYLRFLPIAWANYPAMRVSVGVVKSTSETNKE